MDQYRIVPEYGPLKKKGHITHAEDALAKVSIRTRMQIIDYYWEDYRLLLAHDEEQTTEVGAR